MENDKPLNMYNTMGLSRIQIQISKRQKFDINIVVIKREPRIRIHWRVALPRSSLVAGFAKEYVC